MQESTTLCKLHKARGLKEPRFKLTESFAFPAEFDNRKKEITGECEEIKCKSGDEVKRNETMESEIKSKVTPGLMKSLSDKQAFLRLKAFDST